MAGKLVRVEEIRIQPGDTLVAYYPKDITEEEKAEVERALKAIGATALLLPEGYSVEVLHPVSSEEPNTQPDSDMLGPIDAVVLNDE